MLDKSISLKIRFVVAAGIGLLFGWFQLRFWAIYPVDNPITNWLLDAFARQGQLGLYYLLAYIHDFAEHLVLALVLAIILVRVFGYRQWTLVFVVVVAWHVAMFWDTVWANMDVVVRYWGFWIGLATTLSVVPIAYLLVGRIRRTPSTN